MMVSPFSKSNLKINGNHSIYQSSRRKAECLALDAETMDALMHSHVMTQ